MTKAKKGKKKSFNSFLEKNLKYLILGLILIILFRKYLLFIVLSIPTLIMGMITMKASRVVPHISIESISSAATLIGYIWGWKAGLIFGFVVGMIGWIQVGLVKHTTITTAVFMGFNGMMGGILSSFFSSFYVAHTMAFLIRAPINYIIMGAITSDPIENFMHSFGDSAFSVFIHVHWINLLYILASPFI